MGHKNKASLNQQVSLQLKSKLKIGESKHHHKTIEGDAHKYIFSWSTYHSYQKVCRAFAAYCRSRHRARTLDECFQHADEYLLHRIERGLSPWTIKLDAAGLAKLYGVSTTEFVETPARHRRDIRRSRGNVLRDRHFSEDNHRQIVNFCKSTGLRRRELAALTGDKLFLDANGRYRIRVNKMTKGGRPRDALIIGNVDEVVRIMKAAGTGRVFDNVPNGMDVHGYRADYATAMYSQLESGKSVPQEFRYVCRRDMKGKILDRRIMKIVSQNLGHNRIDIIAQSYLRL